MPCLECENGLWRFGESGKCQYSSKSECETANADYYAEEIDNNNMEEKKKYYGDEEHDYHFNFTTDMMEKLHSEGELEVKRDKFSCWQAAKRLNGGTVSKTTQILNPAFLAALAALCPPC